MNLFEILKTTPNSDLKNAVIPHYLYGAFRRKSITFFNGLSDENTIVYWFQSRSFTIDLRLKSQTETLVHERQGWIGNTIWNTQEQLLSWHVDAHANYQNHVQWPEPAKLHPIGNCILEFSPSNVYVEDWRQQVQQGLFLGLRLKQAIDLENDESLNMDGGLIICDQHIAYCLTRLPETQDLIKNIHFQHTDALDHKAIESFEVSIGIDGQHISYSTISKQVGQTFNLDDFEQIDGSTLVQHRILNGRKIDLFFEIDVFQTDFNFQYITPTTLESENWLKLEESHLMHHAQFVV